MKFTFSHSVSLQHSGVVLCSANWCYYWPRDKFVAMWLVILSGHQLGNIINIFATHSDHARVVW